MSFWRLLPDFQAILAECKPLYKLPAGVKTTKEIPPIWVEHKHDKNGRLTGTIAIIVWRGRAYIAGALPPEPKIGEKQVNFTRAIGKSIAEGRVLKALLYYARKKIVGDKVRVKKGKKSRLRRVTISPPQGRLAFVLDSVPNPKLDEFLFRRAPGSYRDVWTIAVSTGTRKQVKQEEE